MGVYEYTAQDNQGRSLRGRIEADSQGAAVSRLERQSLQVTNISKASAIFRRRPLPASELLLFNSQLASIVEANLPLEEALSDLAQETQSRRLSRVLRQVVEDLHAGTQLDEALERQEGVFGRGYARTVRAGLQSGHLAEMLHSYARHVRVQQETRRIIRGSLAYPLSVVAMSFIILSIVHLLVIPAVSQTGLLSSSRIDVPVQATPGEILESSIKTYLSIVAFSVLVASAFWSLRFWESGRVLRSRILLSLPVVGEIRWRARLAQLADLLAAQVQAGSSLPGALRHAGRALEDQWARRETERMACGIEKGQSLSDAGKGCRYIPPMMRFAMESSAQRNGLPEALHELSEGYYLQAQIAQEKLRAFLFPTAIVTVGFAFCVLLLRMMPFFLPVHDLPGW
jgi:type II secretory pathway component PulF